MGGPFGHPVPHLLSNGTAVNPTYSFALEPSLGFYRRGVGEIGVAVFGVNIGWFGSTGFRYGSFMAGSLATGGGYFNAPYDSGIISSKNNTGLVDLSLFGIGPLNGVENIVTVGYDGVGVIIKARSGAAWPTVVDIPSGFGCDWKNTVTGTFRRYYNNAGTLNYVDLSAAPATTTITDPGQRALNVLRLASDVVEAETVTIGADVYEWDIVGTDTTDDTAGNEWNNVNDPVTVTAATYLNTVFAVGRLVRVENEIMRVRTAGASPTLARGVSGTTAAAHANALNILQSDGIAGGSTVAVGLTVTMVPAASSAALAADINLEATEAVTATRVSANEVRLQADAVGAVTIACTTNMTGANNVWAAANMYGGRTTGPRRMAAQNRIPLATEVALGTLHFVFDFAPTVLSVRMWPTATPGEVSVFDGAVAVVGNMVTLSNTGISDFAATETVQVIVTE